jgi:pimeloyl-ACP methyl ester carboxylesterase
MGGMIAQTIAIEHPERLLSVTSIMSTVGDVRYGRPTDEALATLITPPPSDRQAYVDGATAFSVWSSKRYFDPELMKRKAAEAFDRSFYPEGASRQLAAMCGSGDRTEALRRVTVPTLVIHGSEDTLIAPSGGRRTAELVPGAKLLELADMGHDLPEPLWPQLVEAIVAHGDTAAELTEAGR